MDGSLEAALRVDAEMLERDDQESDGAAFEVDASLSGAVDGAGVREAVLIDDDELTAENWRSTWDSER